MRILVSGGAGFIGSHLCERLLNENNEVICVDNFITGNRKNVVAFKKNKHFSLIEHDINLPIGKGIGKIDQIYHLASPASPVDYKEIPLQTLWVNAAGTKNMLDLAVKNDAAILIASTSEIYGDPKEHPQKESYWGNVNPIGERSCYNEGKRFSESLAINYWKHYRLPLKIVRIFNTYGPRMRKNDGRVIPEFISRALAGEPLPVFGQGKQTRSFCFIDDMIDGLLALMKTKADFVGPVNIGNPDEISIRDLADKIIRLTGSESKISYFSLPEDDPIRRLPDIGLAKKTFGFNPKINLDEGLRRTIRYFSAT
jgi:UDP-glucuronate decarboxylase